MDPCAALTLYYEELMTHNLSEGERARATFELHALNALRLRLEAVQNVHEAKRGLVAEPMVAGRRCGGDGADRAAEVPVGANISSDEDEEVLR